MNGTKDYYARRAVEERDAAGRAASPLARSKHLELAQRYSDMAQARSPDPAPGHSSITPIVTGLKLF